MSEDVVENVPGLGRYEIRVDGDWPQRRLMPIPHLTPDAVVTQAAPWVCAATDRGYAT